MIIATIIRLIARFFSGRGQGEDAQGAAPSRRSRRA